MTTTEFYVKNIQRKYLENILERLSKGSNFGINCPDWKLSISPTKRNMRILKEGIRQFKRSEITFGQVLMRLLYVPYVFNPQKEVL